MARTRRTDAQLEVLGKVIEYRDLLRAELAKVEGHLAVAEELAAARRRRELDCWLASDFEASERLH